MGETIGWAVKQLHHGLRVRRAGWNGKGMWLQLVASHQYVVRPEILSADSYATKLPWVGMRTAQGDFVPWLCSQTDLLAIDWELAE